MAQYISTGANKVRLEAFFKLACILSQLHANGLVYGDISENNIFIANFDNNVIVWLIDSDNLNFQRITSKKIFGTPGYYAPELINPDISKRKGNTFYSDSYSFSIALFTQLTGKYPFMGSFFEEHSEEFEYEEDKEEMAFSGTLPWILDEEDKSNESDTVPPSDLVISKDIRNLFRRTFSKKGRAFRETRPSMVEWAYFLGKEVDNTFFMFPPFYTDFGKNITVGKNVFFNTGCSFQDRGGITIGDGTQIGMNVTIATLNHGFDLKTRNTTYPSPVIIGKNVWSGSNVTIVPGAVIGDNSVIAAGAVVKGTIPENVVAAGCPAKVIRNIEVE
jgi:acetyltransferase-like isoleucine patch superfamily enzyme